MGGQNVCSDVFGIILGKEHSLGLMIWRFKRETVHKSESSKLQSLVFVHAAFSWDISISFPH